MDTTATKINAKGFTESLRWADELRRKEAENLKLIAERHILVDALLNVVRHSSAKEPEWAVQQALEVLRQYTKID